MSKTVITLTALQDLLLDTLEIYKPLIVAPLRVARDTWPAEIKKWEHLNLLDISVITGSAKERISALNRPATLYAINRENIKWLVEYYENNHLRWDFDCIVIDELSSFKNHTSQRFKYLKRIRPFVKRWIGLTGTPTSNGLMDLWAEIGIFDGGERLGRFIGKFREAYFKPAAFNPSTNIVYSYVPRFGAEEIIYKRISDITISMKALDYLNMPDCIFITHEVEMNNSEMKLYNQLKNDFVLPLKNSTIDAVNAGVLSNKLLQMSNGAVYDESKKNYSIHNRKLEKLEDLVESANGQPVLIAYWFKHDLERISAHLKKAGYSPVELKSSEHIKNWNNKNIPVALIHPASAGHGLNIQAGGHILIWFGLTWSLELYQQTNARLWRQGQNNTVTIHHIICKNTIDKNVRTALANKNLTQENLINAVKVHLKK